ncbi:hypothetical protein [Brevibacillus choshinensis]|uniref:Integrase n=1 Tax=Brevibacillus choshinensis TaxID=54911 RepID=A0ABX7FSF2_BRECH|nr:hypothetical protein [Brevibacillus choshinensis]QRG69026.1 hypothetical protein JNE38_07765 [Brevibacillus choshinensis]
MKKISSGSVLSKAYFVSYLQLVMRSRGYDLGQATTYTLHTFFQGDLCAYGQQTYENYLSAVDELRGESY